MTIPEEEILNTNIAYTIIGGEVRYQRGEFHDGDDGYSEGSLDYCLG
jgi:hypothetical protein